MGIMQEIGCIAKAGKGLVVGDNDKGFLPLFCQRQKEGMDEA